jgi:acetyl esterase/lipase
LKQPTEYNTYADIEAAYKCLKEKYGVKDEQLILYGQSVGSGPTLDLASRISELRGVVLHSPILSGLRVLYPVKRTYWFDIYKVEFVTDCVSICFPQYFVTYGVRFTFFSEY